MCYNECYKELRYSMSHLSLRMNQEDENHLRFLEQALGLDRSDATRVALSIAVEYISKKKSDKLQVIQDSAFIGTDTSRKTTRVGFRQKVKAKIAAKYGI